MNNKIIFTFIIIVCQILLPHSVSAQLISHPLQHIDSLQNINKRYIVVFIKTDWCTYCNTMSNTTFKNYDVVNTLNNKFYFSELNAEDKQEIKFNLQTYKFIPSGIKTGIHELAQHLGKIKGEVFYPSICILNKNYEIIFQWNELLSASELLKILNEIYNGS
ncbi:MAG: thioredoxin fold domain-containing protein [Ferruginibacter sp.]